MVKLMVNQYHTSARTDQLNQSLPITGQSRKFRFSLRSLLIFSVVISWLLAGLAFLIREARQTVLLTQCQNNLRQMAMAFHNYHDTHKTFPPAIIYAPDGTPCGFGKGAKS